MLDFPVGSSGFIGSILSFPTVSDDPHQLNTYKEALKALDTANWIKSMDEEMDALLKNATWTVIKHPEHAKVL